MCMGATAFPSKEMQGSFDLRPLLYLRHLWYLAKVYPVENGVSPVMSWDIFLSTRACLLFVPTNTV